MGFHKSTHKHSALPDGRQKWRSITLQPWCVPLLLATELALIVGIITLLVLSQRRTGFVEVGFEARSVNFSSFEGALDWGQGLLWTTLPVFIVGLYKLFRDSVRTALVFETPYIELAAAGRGKAVEAGKSVYLDYRTSFSIVAWWKAWKNKHYFLSLCLILSFVEALALVPLTARLFAVHEELLPRESLLNVLSVFDTAAALANADYGALMDAVAASWINESPLPRGTDGEYAFSRITPMQPYRNFTISAPMNASRLNVDCESVPTSSKTFTLVDESDNIFTLGFSATDRGCPIEGSIAANADSDDFLEAGLTSNCSEETGRSRVTFFYGSLSSTGDLLTPILVSCIPTYWSATGNLTVVTTENSFSDRAAETPRFHPAAHEVEDLGITAQQFEDGVMTVRTFNPATTSAGNTNAPLRLAELIVRSIKVLDQNFSAQNIIDATQRIYPAIYTMLALAYFYPELGTPIQVSGTIAIAQNRLHVVPPVAITMVAILVILFCSTTYLIFYLQSHPSILAEEPIGLFGAANLLSGSNIPDVIERYHRQGIFDGRQDQSIPEGRAKNVDDEVKKAKCWIEPGRRQYSLIVKMAAPSSLQDVAGGMIREDSQRLINEEAPYKIPELATSVAGDDRQFANHQAQDQEMTYVTTPSPGVAGQFYDQYPSQSVGYFNRTTIQRKPVNRQPL
ncbi:uncharacterized protein A1O9_08517 [Exophiala aquamarina CBS 119918]|uniref:Uncharacterized protein n=1 Tax=Exophiala aquamarina CBS 119918 TaxID=1182545 RepID=A0A072P7I3_9EURO|nr:uncharacterized protein A1O9_08517 [Exophiala aquamarina CBS 119918]KEF55766.1 hypothetical protein A1O9_08517 [Exophiala aquamarina CBS 119918]